MNLRVSPDLEKVVAAAKEANIAIHDIQFIRSVDADILEALTILVDGNDDSKKYFTWLLEQSNLKSRTAS